MLKEQFFIRLFLGAISGILLVWSFYKMAGRNSCEGNEPLKHKTLKIFGWILLGFAFLNLVVFFYWFAQIIFPTSMIEPPITSSTVVRPIGRYAIWGQATQLQAFAISFFLGSFLNLALSLYCLSFQKTNVSGWRKFGKVVFCIFFVMFYLTATDFHYFDIHEFKATIGFGAMAAFALFYHKKDAPSKIEVSEEIPL